MGKLEKEKKETKEDIFSLKKKLLSNVLERIDSQYGKGSIMVLGEKNVSYENEVISTGSLLLDEAIGCGGIPKGRVVEIFGPEASGKTTIALQIISEVQKNNGIAAFIDAEHALDLTYCKNLGINVKDLVLSQPDYGEQALDITETLVRSNSVDVIVVDSVAALVPKSELEGDMGDTHMGLQARLMSQALRKLTPLVNKSKVVLIFINQIRQNIGVMGFGPKEATTGGNALKFYSSLRFDVRRIESLKNKNGEQYGNMVRIKVVKNKLARPFVSISSHLIFGYGISKYYELMTLGIEKGLIELNGSWVYMQGEKLCQGKDSFISLLKKDNALYSNLHSSLVKEMSKKIFETL